MASRPSRTTVRGNFRPLRWTVSRSYPDGGFRDASSFFFVAPSRAPFGIHKIHILHTITNGTGCLPLHRLLPVGQGFMMGFVVASFYCFQYMMAVFLSCKSPKTVRVQLEVLVDLCATRCRILWFHIGRRKQKIKLKNC